METEQPSLNSPFAAVRITEFRYFIIQRFFFIMAMRMVATMVLWKIYLLTKDPLQVSLVGLSEAIPAISLALYSGHVVDKSNKRNLLFRSILLYLLCVTALLFINFPSVEANMGKHFVQYGIYLIIFCTGVIRSFSGPTTSSFLAQLVPKSLLPNAVTWSSTTWLSGSVLGHGSAGLLIAYVGYSQTLPIVMGYLAISAICVWLIKPKPIQHTNAEQKTWESVKEGLKFVWNTKDLLGAFLLDMLAVLFGGTVALLPFFAAEILHVGPVGFGWLNAATDIGSMIMILSLTFFPIKRKQGLTLLYVVAGYGLCIVIFGFSKVFWLSFIALLVSGMLDGISVVIRGTILQLKTPDNMRGRVSSVNSMFINSSNEIGQVESGLAARLLGVVPSVIFGGAMTLLVVGVMWFKAPSLRKFEY
ncbi:MFS transporter [Paraflavitalea pollutisoli]|uniref:MFS transporter n=1 Tax=Paraflavitalea pollutisoli TaxID=3034143 RepID=UPI0023ED0AFD|nr:MFS transporter [Paraflavitalea sp. H1-2-19X]